MHSLPTNHTPPYQHWHAKCASCSRLIFVQGIVPPGAISYPAAPPEAKCPHCGHTQRYPAEALVLHNGFGTLFGGPGAGTGSKTEGSGTLAVIAGMVAAVRLARVESEEITRGSPRVRGVIRLAMYHPG